MRVALLVDRSECAVLDTKLLDLEYSSLVTSGFELLYRGRLKREFRLLFARFSDLLLRCLDQLLLLFLGVGQGLFKLVFKLGAFSLKLVLLLIEQLLHLNHLALQLLELLLLRLHLDLNFAKFFLGDTLLPKDCLLVSFNLGYMLLDLS